MSISYRSKATHGYCGFHFHFGSSEDKPWCRTRFNCGDAGAKRAPSPACSLETVW